MEILQDRTLLVTLILFFAIGVVSITHNKQIANYLARDYSVPLKWIFGERDWVEKNERFAAKYTRVLLYIASLISFLIVSLIITSVFFE